MGKMNYMCQSADRVNSVSHLTFMSTSCVRSPGTGALGFYEKSALVSTIKEPGNTVFSFS